MHISLVMCQQERGKRVGVGVGVGVGLVVRLGVGDVRKNFISVISIISELNKEFPAI